MSQVLIAGCGYVGTALAQRLRIAGHEVVGWRRRATSGMGTTSVDLADRFAVAKALARGPRFDVVVYAAGADRGDEAAYRRAYADGLTALRDGFEEAGGPPRWLCFTSSTSVYHQRASEWVDETSPTEPCGFRGRTLLEAEAIARGGFATATALRLGGIYGPGRTRLAAQVRDGQPTLEPRSFGYTNRIHRDDAAGALAHMIERTLTGWSPPEVVLGVDDEPATQRDVLNWLAQRLGVALVERAEGADAAALRARRPGSKRCRNQRLRASGYAFAYPTFREGYTAVLQADPNFPNFRP